MALVARRSELYADAADFMVSHDPTACREILRYVVGTMDRPAGGVRHRQPG